MPNVLIFKENLLPPSETFILAQMRALKDFAPTLAGLERVSGGLTFHENPILLSIHPGKWADFRAKTYRRTAIAPLFHHHIQQAAPALLHAHFASGGKTLLPLKRRLHVPLVVTLHGGSDVPVVGRDLGAYRELAQQADLFLCVSRFIRDRAVQAGYPPEKLRIHHIGIDRTLFRPSCLLPAHDSILFVGRLVEMKGCEYLLRAMLAIQASRPGCFLTIVGDGPLRAELEQLANDLGVRCEFLGVQPSAKIRQMLHRARLLALPSVSAIGGHVEGLGMVLLEAQASGVPVVATNHAGITDCVTSGQTGFLVPERDVEALARAVIELLANKELWAQFRLQALDRISREFDLQRQTEELESHYSSALSIGK